MRYVLCLVLLSSLWCRSQEPKEPEKLVEQAVALRRQALSLRVKAARAATEEAMIRFEAQAQAAMARSHALERILEVRLWQPEKLLEPPPHPLLEALATVTREGRNSAVDAFRQAGELRAQAAANEAKAALSDLDGERALHRAHAASELRETALHAVHEAAEIAAEAREAAAGEEDIMAEFEGELLDMMADYRQRSRQQNATGTKRTEAVQRLLDEALSAAGRARAVQPTDFAAFREAVLLMTCFEYSADQLAEVNEISGHAHAELADRFILNLVDGIRLALQDDVTGSATAFTSAIGTRRELERAAERNID